MKKGPLITIIIIVIIVILVILIGWWFYASQSNNAATITPPVTTSTGGAPFDQSISDGTIALQFPSIDFASATSQQEILVSSYIPPCDDGFIYCLYYNNTSTYAGTNFETAGIRIQRRADLTTQSECLTTPPSGFTDATSTVASSSDYATSLFPNVGGAAAGHFANGQLYRLFYPATSACYEFETRVGQSDFENYPSGSIQQFTTADQTAVQSELQQILSTLTLPSGESVTFPQS